MKFLFLLIVSLFALTINAEDRYTDSSEFKAYKDSLKTMSKNELRAETSKNFITFATSSAAGVLVGSGAAAASTVCGGFAFMYESGVAGLRKLYGEDIPEDSHSLSQKLIYGVPEDIIHWLFLRQDVAPQKAMYKLKAIDKEKTRR